MPPKYAKVIYFPGSLYGTSVEDAIEEIKKDNLFQYLTERLVARMVRSCYKLMDALDDEQLRQELSSAPDEIAKQINLYAMMHYNRIPQLIDAPAGYVTTDQFPYNEYMVHPMNTYVKTK